MHSVSETTLSCALQRLLNAANGSPITRADVSANAQPNRVAHNSTNNVSNIVADDVFSDDLTLGITDYEPHNFTFNVANVAAYI
jgi:hypothetical protein